MVSWPTIQTLLFTLGPLLLPRLIGYYRSFRSGGGNGGGGGAIAIQAVPTGARRALHLLFLSALVALLSTLAVFQPENILARTQSRLQTPTHVLFRRLGGMRPLTDSDEALQAQLAASLDAKLHYLAYGPGPIQHCAFCAPDDATAYLYYAGPALVAPHLLHLAVLGLATSADVTGCAAVAGWRTPATIAGVGLGLVELYVRGSYDVRANARARQLSELDFFHWRMLLYRGVALALVDAWLAAMLYLTATNRAFLTPQRTLAHRLEVATSRLAAAHRKLHALAVTHDVAVRDPALRAAADAYWEADGRAMREVDASEEVIRALATVRARLDLPALTKEATAYADAVVDAARRVVHAGPDEARPPPSPSHVVVQTGPRKKAANARPEKAQS
ncbi:MAG: hypothetical protein M1826_005815 [Phylliscum demangeonii]|nr:MAG: hypothetical protein M1826_005815 [Phylliscum demangeonii]